MGEFGAARSAKSDPFGASELRPANADLTSPGFGFQDTRAPQALPQAWQDLLQPLFDRYGVDLADAEVIVRESEYAGEYLGGNRFVVDKGRLFSPLTSGAWVADTLAHETSHIWQSRIMRVNRAKMLKLINIETAANREAGVHREWFPRNFGLPAPNRLPGIAPLEGISARFGKEGGRLWWQALR
jgi:hypothetical protein